MESGSAVLLPPSGNDEDGTRSVVPMLRDMVEWVSAVYLYHACSSSCRRASDLVCGWTYHLLVLATVYCSIQKQSKALPRIATPNGSLVYANFVMERYYFHVRRLRCTVRFEFAIDTVCTVPVGKFALRPSPNRKNLTLRGRIQQIHTVTTTTTPRRTSWIRQAKE
jgi:hypothetical protein